MNFRQTAALGLITLLLGGNTTLPYASAATIALGSPSQAKHQLGEMIDHHLMLAVAEQQQLIHPIHKKRTLLDRLNPLSYMFPSNHPKFTIAKAVPINKAIRAMAAPKPVTSADLPTSQRIARAQETIHPQGHAAKHGKSATPLNPTASANPAIIISPVSEADAAPSSTQPEGQGNAASAPTQVSYTQILPAALQQNPTFEAIYQTYDPQNWNIVYKSTTEETFQLLAASPLDKLALQTRSAANMFYAPGLDSSPDISTRTDGGVKVLKSGISQKVTNVDLAIGKAEVLYLSHPASRVSVSNPDVATAVVISPTQIQLVGKAVGVANLLVWGDMVSPNHTVVDISVHRDVSVLVNQLKYVDPGIQIVPMAAEDTVILTGQAETRESAQLAIEMAKAFFNKSQAGASAMNNGPSSQAPGSAVPGVSTNVINLIKVKGEPSTKVELVRQRMREVDPNIRVDVVPGPEGNEKVILTGRVASASIASKALNLASVFYGQPGLKMVTAQGGNDFSRMQTSSNSSASSGSGSTTTVSTGASAGAANVLQGSVMTDATGNVISMLEIAQKPQVRCSIKFLELKKTALNAMGNSLSGARGSTKFVSWSGVHSSAPANPISTPSTQSPPGAGWVNTATRDALGNGWRAGTQSINSNWNEVFQNGVTQVFTINNQMTAAIQALQERRQIRTLAEPTLTIMSGEQGSFLAGGEIPIAFLGGNGQISIEFHEYGIRLNLLPNITDDGKIQMQVSPEVSAVDTSVSVQGVPGFTTRRMSTSLIIEPNQSFALAGLYNQEDTDSLSRLPGAGSLPILGSFFRNKWKSHSNTELVVLIKPEVIYSQTGPTGIQTGMEPAETPAISKK